MKRLLVLVPLALLAACSGDEPTPEPTSSAAQPVQTDPTAAASDPAGPGTGLVEIPAGFLGYWDAVDGRCANWSEGQLTIEPRRVQFYESVGEVTGLRQNGADTIEIDFAMSGEGDTWSEQATYRLLDGGKVLESRFTNGEGFRRKRCEALLDMPME